MSKISANVFLVNDRSIKVSFWDTDYAEVQSFDLRSLVDALKKLVFNEEARDYLAGMLKSYPAKNERKKAFLKLAKELSQRETPFLLSDSEVTTLRNAQLPF